jgi:hypothetical protein
VLCCVKLVNDVLCCVKYCVVSSAVLCQVGE